jgi:hypothetical protein
LAIRRLLCKGLRRCEQYEKRRGHHGDMCECGREDTKGSQISLAQRNGWLLHYSGDCRTAGSVCIIVIRDIALRVACGSAKAVASDADSVLYLTQETSAVPANRIAFCH